MSICPLITLWRWRALVFIYMSIYTSCFHSVQGHVSIPQASLKKTSPLFRNSVTNALFPVWLLLCYFKKISFYITYFTPSINTSCLCFFKKSKDSEWKCTVPSVWKLFVFSPDQHQQDKENLLKACLTILPNRVWNHKNSETHFFCSFTAVIMSRSELLQQNTHKPSQELFLKMYLRVFHGLPDDSLCCKCPWNSFMWHQYEPLYGSSSKSEIKYHYINCCLCN